MTLDCLLPADKIERDENALGMDDAVETMLFELLSDGIDFSPSAMANAETEIAIENKTSPTKRYSVARHWCNFSPTFTFPPRS